MFIVTYIYIVCKHVPKWIGIQSILFKKKNETTQLILGLVNEVPPKKDNDPHQTTHDLTFSELMAEVPLFCSYRRHNLVSWSLLVDPFLVSLGTLIPEKLAGYFNRSSCDRPLNCSGSPPLFLSPKKSLFKRLLRLKTYLWKILFVVLTIISCTNHFTCKKYEKAKKKGQMFAVPSVAEIPTASVLAVQVLTSSLPFLVFDGYYNIWIHVISMYIA